MKEENETTSLKKLGYGLKYTLVVAFAILAICALCFIFISITTYFAPPLQPMFDQERLGQLGDFLGGTLNPIFGFVTVCLLLWSVFVQRQELSLTRKDYDTNNTSNLIETYKNKFFGLAHKESKYSLTFVYEKKDQKLGTSKATPFDNLFSLYRQILSTETVEKARPMFTSWLNEDEKKPRNYFVQVIYKNKMQEYASGIETDIMPLLEMRNAAIYIAQLTHSLMMLNNNETIKAIFFKEAETILKIQSYFVSKDDTDFIEELPKIFQSKIRTLIQDRKFDYTPGISLQELIQEQ